MKLSILTTLLLSSAGALARPKNGDPALQVLPAEASATELPTTTTFIPTPSFFATSACFPTATFVYTTTSLWYSPVYTVIEMTSTIATQSFESSCTTYTTSVIPTCDNRGAEQVSLFAPTKLELTNQKAGIKDKSVIWNGECVSVVSFHPARTNFDAEDDNDDEDDKDVVVIGELALRSPYSPPQFTSAIPLQQPAPPNPDKPLEPYMIHAYNQNRSSHTRKLERIFNPSSFTHPPTLRRYQTNHILIFSGSFNPPHYGHQQTLTHAFLRLKGELNLVAAIVYLGEDKQIATKMQSAENPVTIPKQIRLQMWNSAPIEGGWHWVWADTWSEFRTFSKDLIAMTKKAGYTINFVNLFGPDHLWSSEILEVKERNSSKVIICGHHSRAHISRKDGSLMPVTNYSPWKEFQSAKDFVTSLSHARGSISESWANETLVTMFPHLEKCYWVGTPSQQLHTILLHFTGAIQTCHRIGNSGSTVYYVPIAKLPVPSPEPRWDQIYDPLPWFPDLNTSANEIRKYFKSEKNLRLPMILSLFKLIHVKAIMDFKAWQKSKHADLPVQKGIRDKKRKMPEQRSREEENIVKQANKSKGSVAKEISPEE
ncbi:hypothetical protein BCR34DRAFT_585064 [Clohesyomyces aquaticus]|uniref:Cytidyltransferase-like domain-containing protein n=1 Tax=Clohesyomyces aquaticus TaxID=1231657 RepID=A0A1Y1ZYR2_9PLEO|nr:hypothetical protein BCR34DRAFT_585064 [Clohesyomyces aquaticus]